MEGKKGACIHLRVQDASGRLHNADSLIVRRDRVESLLGVLEHSNELQAHVPRVHVGAEAVRHGLLLTGRDHDFVALRGQVAQDDAFVADIINEGAADYGHGDGFGLLVLDGEARLGGMAVDELNAEDFRVREAGGDADGEIGRNGLGGHFFDLWGSWSVVDVMSLREMKHWRAHLDVGQNVEGLQREQEQR
jgi:hypothetical protein